MMRAAMILIAGLAGCTMEEPATVSEGTHDRVAEAVAGRIAGDPVDCVDRRDLRANRVVGEDAILFEGQGDTIYINRAGGSCAILRHGRSLRSQTISSRLCRGDIVTVFDPVSGAEFGGCPLSEFVPYRRTG